MPQSEICDGKDNDCDGETDEGLTLEQQCGISNLGICSFGSEHKYCLNEQYTSWQNCTAIWPQPEACDNLDNNCNGSTDENLTQLCSTTCGEGLEICLEGAWQGCTAVQPKSEICDNLDNDCDEAIDNDLSKICGSACGEGLEVCINGIWLDCNAPLPQIEVCDGLDNNCNGIIDDTFNVSQICYVGIGECKSEGTIKCNETGFESYCDAITKNPTEEICDGLDNDCNSLIDENMTEACSTVCGEGYKICKDGVIQECDALKPNLEICDGLDNNCDGKIDNDICCLDKLVGYWNLNEGFGNIANDASGKGNNGTIIGGASWVDGVVGKALSFDGKDDYVNIGSDSSIKPDQDLSLLAWFKTNGKVGATQAIMRYRMYGWLIWMGNGHLIHGFYSGVGSACYPTSSKTYDDSQWHFVAVTADYTENSGTMVNLYVDGQLDLSTFCAGKKIYYESGSAAIGREGNFNSAYFNGTIDEVEIYSCALSPEQIEEEYKTVVTIMK